MSSFNVILWLVSQVTKTVSCIIFRFFPSNNNNKNTFDFLVVASKLKLMNSLWLTRIKVGMSLNVTKKSAGHMGLPFALYPHLGDF